MVLAAESVIIFQVLLALWTILSSGHNPRGYRFHNAQTRLYGPDHKRSRPVPTSRNCRFYLRDREVVVDVYITTYGEELDTIRRTVSAAVAMDGRHNTYILDDGKSDEVRALAAAIGGRATSPRGQHRRQGRQHQPRAVGDQGRVLRHPGRRLRAQGGFPVPDGAVLRREHGRIRPDPAGLRQSRAP